MAALSEEWVENSNREFIENLMDDSFHAVNFDVNGKHYCFAGWWILDWGDDDKIYDSKEEFINDPVFNGKKISEVKIENADFEFQSW